MRKSSVIVIARMSTATFGQLWKEKWWLVWLSTYVWLFLGKITFLIFNLGGTSASKAFFDAMYMELGTLSSADRAFVRVEKADTHVSHLDWRRPDAWSTSEVQIQSVSWSVKKTGQFFSRFFNQVAIPNCRLCGIEQPHAPSFSNTLVKYNIRARFVQDTSSLEYPDRLEELGDFYRNQPWCTCTTMCLDLRGSHSMSLAIKVSSLP